MRITHVSLKGLWIEFKSGKCFAINLRGWAITKPNGYLIAANLPAFWRIVDRMEGRN